MARNLAGTLLASAARALAQAYSSADQINYNAKGVRVFVNVTAVTATPSLVVTIEVKDPVSGVYTAILTSAAIATAVHTVLTVYPGATVAAGVTLSIPLGKIWRVTVTHGDTDSATYSVGYATLV
jgi:hypothetical protein